MQAKKTAFPGPCRPARLTDAGRPRALAAAARSAPVFVLALVGLLCAAGLARAGRLEPAAEAPRWLQLGADLLLFAHVGGGSVGILAGVVASFSRKGERVHRLAGRVFLASMLVCYLVAAGVAPFLEEGRPANTVAAVFASYLLLSGAQAARVRTVRAGGAVALGLGIAASVAGLGVVFAVLGASQASGTLDGSPPQAFSTFIVGGLAAALGELNVLRRGQVSGVSRIVRHLWRMGASFFYASGSFFLGQPQVFPDAFNRTPLPALLAFLPLLVVVGWILGLERRRWRTAVPPFAKEKP